MKGKHLHRDIREMIEMDGILHIQLLYKILNQIFVNSNQYTVQIYIV